MTEEIPAGVSIESASYMENNSDTKIDEDLIKKFAPKVIEGTKRIKDWVEKA